MDKVSIIVPSYNRKELLGTCLNSIKNQDYPDKEIIVVDDGSTDGTSSYIKDLFPHVKITRNNRPLGPAYAKNLGIVNSSGRYIYFLDSDSELIYKDTISAMVRTMESNEKIGSLGGIVELDAAGAVTRVCGRKVAYDGRSYTISLENRKSAFPGEIMAECDFVETCNCFTRRDIVLTAGGFDPYYIYMGEDKELGMRIRKAGYKNFFGFKVACAHRLDEAVSFDRRLMYLKAKTRFAIKNFGVRYLFIMPILDILFYYIYYPICVIIKRTASTSGGERAAENRAAPHATLPPMKWILCSAYYFLKAYLWNIQELPVTLRSRNVNFLSDENMKDYAVQKSPRYGH